MKYLDKNKWLKAKRLAHKKYFLGEDMLMDDGYYNVDAIFLIIKEYSVITKSTLTETFSCVAYHVTTLPKEFHPSVVKFFKRWKKLNNNLTSS